MRHLVSAFLATVCLTAPSAALAQETVDIGHIKNSDVTVVQDLLYPLEGRTELGMHLGVMPFDAYLWTPNAQLTVDIHNSDKLSFGAAVGGGYGLKTGTYNELESETYQVAPDAYRYLASVLGGIQYTPIYAKMNLNGARVVHFDIYLSARAGVSFEQSVLPKTEDNPSIVLAPTVSPGLGTRFFVSPRGAVRVEIRDDIMYEHRALTDTNHIKQNANVTVGYTLLSPAKERRR
jgi:outer membrane beta-barrel protein